MEHINGYYGIRVPCESNARDPDGVRDWWWKAPTSALHPVWAFPEWIAMLNRNATSRYSLLSTSWSSSKTSAKEGFEAYLNGSTVVWPTSSCRGPLADKKALQDGNASMWAYLWDVEEDLVSIYRRAYNFGSTVGKALLDTKYGKKLGLTPVFTLPRALFEAQHTANVVGIAVQQNAQRIKANQTAFEVVGNYVRGELPEKDASMEHLSDEWLQAVGFSMCIGRHFDEEHHDYALNSLTYIPPDRRSYVQRCLISLLACSRTRRDFARELFLFVELCQLTAVQIERALKLFDDHIDLAKALQAWFDLDGGDPAQLLRLIAVLGLTPEQLKNARDQRADMQVSVA